MPIVPVGLRVPPSAMVIFPPPTARIPPSIRRLPTLADEPSSKRPGPRLMIGPARSAGVVEDDIVGMVEIRVPVALTAPLPNCPGSMTRLPAPRFFRVPFAIQPAPKPRLPLGLFEDDRAGMVQCRNDEVPEGLTVTVLPAGMFMVSAVTGALTTMSPPSQLAPQQRSPAPRW